MWQFILLELKSLKARFWQRRILRIPKTHVLIEAVIAVVVVVVVVAVVVVVVVVVSNNVTNSRTNYCLSMESNNN